jgi:hypothetical protein
LVTLTVAAVENPDVTVADCVKPITVFPVGELVPRSGLQELEELIQAARLFVVAAV